MSYKDYLTVNHFGGESDGDNFEDDLPPQSYQSRVVDPYEGDTDETNDVEMSEKMGLLHSVRVIARRTATADFRIYLVVAFVAMIIIAALSYYQRRGANAGSAVGMTGPGTIPGPQLPAPTEVPTEEPVSMPTEQPSLYTRPVFPTATQRPIANIKAKPGAAFKSQASFEPAASPSVTVLPRRPGETDHPTPLPTPLPSPLPTALATVESSTEASASASAEAEVAVEAETMAPSAEPTTAVPSLEPSETPTGAPVYATMYPSPKPVAMPGHSGPPTLKPSPRPTPEVTHAAVENSVKPHIVFILADDLGWNSVRLLTRLEMRCEAGGRSFPGTPTLPLASARCAFAPPGRSRLTSRPGAPTPLF